MDWELVLDSLGPLVRGAVLGTIPLALASFALGLVIALVVALMRLSRMRATTRASARPRTNDVSVTGMVPVRAPRTIGHSEVLTSSQSMVSAPISRRRLRRSTSPRSSRGFRSP